MKKWPRQQSVFWRRKNHFEYLVTWWPPYLIKQVSITASFRYSLGPSEIGDDSTPVHDKMRFTADTKVRSKRFDSGVRIRYRLRYHHSSTWEGNSRDYLRNKLLLDYNFNKEMSPYAAAELYFRLGEMEFQKFRLYLGTDIKFFKRNLELSYILEGDIDNTYFRSYHMMGLFFHLWKKVLGTLENFVNLNSH